MVVANGISAMKKNNLPYIIFSKAALPLSYLIYSGV